MESFKTGTDTLFLLLGAAMVLAMHAGFAFLELGTVRRENQVNALVKILVDFAVSTLAYFFIGYNIAYGVQFMHSADILAERLGPEFILEIVEGASPIGSGSLPSEELPTCALRITHPSIGADAIAAMFRRARPPVIGRIRDGAFLLDLRTVEDAALLAIRLPSQG